MGNSRVFTPCVQRNEDSTSPESRSSKENPSAKQFRTTVSEMKVEKREKVASFWRGRVSVL